MGMIKLIDFNRDITANLETSRRSNGKGFNEYPNSDKQEWLDKIQTHDKNQSFNSYYSDVLRGFVTITNYSKSQATEWLGRYIHVIRKNHPNKVTAYKTIEEIALLFTTPHKCPVCHQYEFPYYSCWAFCEVCNWRDDHIQEENPNLKNSANILSLNEAIELYKCCKRIEY